MDRRLALGIVLFCIAAATAIVFVIATRDDSGGTVHENASEVEVDFAAAEAEAGFDLIVPGALPDGLRVSENVSVSKRSLTSGVELSEATFVVKGSGSAGGATVIQTPGKAPIDPSRIFTEKSVGAYTVRFYAVPPENPNLRTAQFEHDGITVTISGIVSADFTDDDLMRLIESLA